MVRLSRYYSAMHLYAFPALSGVLLSLSFFPFYLWWLVCVALVPLYYFALAPERTRRELFFGGAITGVVGIGPLVYFSLGQTIMFSNAPLFTYTVQLSGIPAIFGIAALFGAMVYGYARVRTLFPMGGSLVAGVFYVLVEAILMWVFGGYYFGSLAHAVVLLPIARTLAALGGTALVSFVIIVASALVAELVRGVIERRDFATLLIAPALFVVGLFAWHGFTGNTELDRPTQTLSVAVLQPAPVSTEDLSYGREVNGVFLAPELAEALAGAADGADLVIYPFSPVDGVVYRGAPPTLSGINAAASDEAIGRWLEGTVSADTTVMFWNTLAEEEKLFDEYAFWRAGEKFSYRKQKLYLFSDYVPQWMREWGLARAPFDITAGASRGTIAVKDAGMSGLVCSELHNRPLTPQERRDTDILVAVGSDSFFPGSLVGNFSIAAAQYYAARYNMPVIRGTIDGPSALIAADGSILTSLKYGEQGMLRGEIIFPGRSEQD